MDENSMIEGQPVAKVRRQRGAAMVEMALVVPLLLLMVFGIIEFGRAYNANISVTHAAREGVREYAISGDAGAGTAAAVGATSLPVSVSVTACNIGDPTTMVVTSPFSFNIPFVPIGAITLSAEGVMRCGG